MLCIMSAQTPTFLNEKRLSKHEWMIVGTDSTHQVVLTCSAQKMLYFIALKQFHVSKDANVVDGSRAELVEAIRATRTCNGVHEPLPAPPALPGSPSPLL